MQERIQQCPKCGSLVIKMINSKTNESFYKCSNENCHFRLRTDYEEEDVFLQGKKLKTVCKGCGYPLEIACGPHGLYAKCYHCSIDTNPRNGLPRWSNARSFNAKAEIKYLIEQYKKDSYINYGFDESTSYYSTEEIPNETIQDIKEPEHDSTLNLSSSIIGLVKTLEANENLMLSSDELAKIANVNPATTRNYLKQLREIGEVKVVGYRDVGSGPLVILYQSKNSKMEPLKIVTREEGYDTVTNFYKEQKELLSSSVTPTSIAQALKNAGIQMYPLLTEKGIMRGYSKEQLKSLSSLFKKSNKESEESISIQTHLPIEIPTKKVSPKNLSSTQEQILTYLKENIYRGVNAKEISDNLGLPVAKVQHNIYLLKEQGKIKVVGLSHTEESKSGFHGTLVQVISSSLPTLKITKDLKRFTTLKRFLSTHSKVKMEAKKALRIVEEANVEEFPVIINKRLFKGYRIQDLKEVLHKAQKERKRAPYKKRKTTVSVEAPTTVVENTPVISERSSKGLISAFSNFFKRQKEYTEKLHSDVISF